MLSAAALVAANMIGAGVFTTSGFALADLGRPSFVLIAWVVGGGVAVCGALSYAALAERIPGNGGEYLFLSRSIHPVVGFLAGWISLLAGFTAPIAVAAHSLEAYVQGSFGFDFPPRVLGATAILLCGLGHGWARSAGLGIQNIAVVTKILAIAGFILFGGFVLLYSVPVPSAPTLIQQEVPFSLSSFAVTLVWISFAYSGWNAAVYVSGELDESRRSLPRAMLIATVAITLLYVALNAVFMASAPISQLAGRAEVGAIAAEALGGPAARAALSGIVALGLLTSISAMVMVGPRVYAQMANDGLLPRPLASSEAEPRGAIALQVGLALIAFFVSDLQDLLLYAGFLLSLSAAATVGCLFLPQAEDKAHPPARVAFWYAALFILVTLASCGFMIFREPAQAASGVSTLALGLAVYWGMTRRGGRGDGEGG